MGVFIMKDDRKETIIRSYYKYFRKEGIPVTRESLLDPHGHRPIFKEEFVKDAVSTGHFTKDEAEETFNKNFK